ncbi:hypothetical protein CHU92_01610 [Flavobacterium cyanobacteriorum]|uniref:Uncharacterized protein n=1 Tax=Flavobacterium cyanobacteriorum TaxID=2022802 RepID=A0A255ZXG0_9FLAO|nr:hypothetical protein [Flavobacterium cyanobacteriorum]OYQ46126.1 hypothetical protein CHU92_01610 [Flavobacterium cyanobacteriorum]
MKLENENSNEPQNPQLNIGAVSGSLNNIYLFKVRDFTTTLLGRFEDGKYFIQRGDGTKYEYDEYRVVWKRKLNCH